MPITIVVGGQFGGEGKGAVAGFLASTRTYDLLVKTGGPNSSHTFGRSGALFDVRMIPSGSNYCSAPIVLPPGCLIHVRTLEDEIKAFGCADRVFIDPQAGIIEDAHVDEQKHDEFYRQVGSTRRGTGAATAQRARRRLRLARGESELQPYLRDTQSLLSHGLRDGAKILVEGGQGYALSNYHGEYPFVTSRDTTAAACLSQVGLGMRYVDQIVLAVKAFPTRNPEGQGRLSSELDLRNPELHRHLLETMVSSAWGGALPRRVGLFDFDQFRRACVANTPTAIAMTGLDKLENGLSHPDIQKHYASIESFKARVEERAECGIALEGWGPYIEDMRWIRPW